MSNLRFSELANLCNELEVITKRKILVQKLINFLDKCGSEDSIIVIRLLNGEILDIAGVSLNLYWSSFYDAILKSTNVTNSEFSKVFRKTGDIGNAVEEIFEKHPPRRQLTLFASEAITCKEVLEFINRIASFTGKGSKKRKQDYLSSFISRLSPLEAKCLVKTLLRDLRIGISTGILEEALAKKFNIPLDDLKKAHMIVGSLAYLLSHILKHGPSVIYHVQPVFFNPLKVMLADTAETPEEILKYHGGITSLEYKLDGIRVQIHKEGEQVKIFTRRLNEITSYLPEIVSQMREKRFNFIVDGEIIGIDKYTKKPLAFQDLMHRFKLEHLRNNIIEEIPVRLFLFDILLFEDESYIDKPYYIRHEALQQYFSEFIVPTVITNDPEYIQSFFKRAIKDGHEGLVAKNLFSKYIPGKRKRYWLKFKFTHETIDAVIVAAEYGYGRRHNWLSDYYLAVKDTSTNEFVIVGKTFKGLTDEEFEEITKKLEETATQRNGHKVIVIPTIVVEVEYNEIQKSPKYKSGFALRFARIKRIRYDKSPDEINTIDDVKRQYMKQLQYKGILKK